MKLKALFATILLACTSFHGICADERPVPPSNHVRLTGEVTEASVKTVMTAMSAATQAKAAYILLEINSPGGEVDSGFLLAKAIEESPIRVICVVDGSSMSMAMYILQSCHTRYMTERSTLMMHKPSGGGFMNGTDISYAILADYLHHLTDAMVTQYSHRLNIPKEKVRARIDWGEWFLNAEEAAEIGAVDGVTPTVARVIAQQDLREQEQQQAEQLAP